MTTNVFTNGKSLISEYAQGTVSQQLSPVVLKPKADPGFALHANSSKKIANPANTVNDHNTPVATEHSYLDDGRHAANVLMGRYTFLLNGPNGFGTYAKNFWMEGRLAVMDGVSTTVNVVWSKLAPELKKTVENAHDIIGGITPESLKEAGIAEGKEMLDELMSIETLIELAKTAAMAAAAAIPVVGWVIGGAAVAMRAKSAAETAADVYAELKEIMGTWDKPMTPAQKAVARKAFEGWILRGGARVLLAVIGKIKLKRSGKAKTLAKDTDEKYVGNKKDPPKETGCACGTKSPVIIASGEKSLTESDFSLPGLIDLEWIRKYRSGDIRFGWFGQGWSTPLAVELTLSAHQLTYHDASGRCVPLPAIGPGVVHVDAYEGMTLAHPTPDEWELAFKDGETQHFRRVRDDQFVLPLARISDRNGNLIKFEYAAPPDDVFLPWRARAIVDAGARRLLLDWTEQGLLRRVSVQVDPVAPALTLAAYSYTESGELATQTDASGAQRSYEWRHHVLTAYTNLDGTRYCADYDEYSPAGRVLRSYTAADGLGLAFDYNERARTTSVTDAIGRVTRYEYDERKDIIAIVAADGSRAESPYDANGNPRGPVDALGRQAQFRFDAGGNLTEAVDVTGARTAFVYDARDRPVKYTNALKHSWLSEYDGHGNLVAEVDPLGQTTRYAYDARGLPTSVTDARGGIARLDWDAAGNLTVSTDCSGQSTHFAYDGMGRVVSETDALGNCTQFEWDLAGNQTALIEPDGATHRYEWSAGGNLLRYVDPLGAVTAYRYNIHGEPCEERDANGHSVKYVYDAVGRLVQLINENGETSVFAYDLENRLTDEIGFDGCHRRYCYDLAGLLSHEIEAGGSDLGPGKVTRYQRDPLGRMLGRQCEGEPDCDAHFQYDVLGSLVSARNANSELSFGYDALGQRLSETQTLLGGPTAQKRVLTHRYDVLGNRVQTTFPDQRAIHRLFYGSGHLHQVNVEAPGTHDTHRLIVDIERDGLHREVKRYQGHIDSHFSYDPMGRLARQRVTGTATTTRRGSAHAIDRQYRYDLAGNLDVADDAARGKKTYTYDRGGRLIASTGNRDEFFAFDPTGNVRPVQPQCAHSPVRGNRVDVVEDVRYTYDFYGNVITRNKGAHEQAFFRWNANHQLAKSIVVRHGVTRTTSYEYDALGRRTRKGDAFGGTVYLWDGDVMVQSQRGSKGATFLYEPGSFVPMATLQQDEVFWYHCDQIGTPLELTNQQGEVVWDADWTTWGEPWLVKSAPTHQTVTNETSETQTPIEQPLRFQGQQYDDETGLHYNKSLLQN
ncbi:DUF6531 domain-containing protein [Massilia genomosp. 1]|uniref:RHS repeat protein n=1 Tax=Massilia genomosp. 1 TaxID=2609280 RepID=A0ABX0MYH8_9BURK|nr:DUF6531 domain-containing protein [Massilia genomosp. 1]NHZ64324.1 RHS repeat protein [Massilia genomosp. 1]